MCLSAEVDLAAGIAIVAIGVDAMRHTEHRKERHLAFLPVVFGVHQLVEVPVWLSLEGAVADEVGRAAAFVYLLIAYAVLPIYVPFAVRSIESPPRRRLGLAFLVAGAGVAVALVYHLISGPLTTTIVGHHIDYRIDVWNLYLVIGVYVFATCGPLLTSTIRAARWFGGANVVAIVVLGWVDQSAFVSLWCFWAAIVSAGIAAYLRLSQRDPAADAAALPASL